MNPLPPAQMGRRQGLPTTSRQRAEDTLSARRRTDRPAVKNDCRQRDPLGTPATVLGTKTAIAVYRMDLSFCLISVVTVVW